MNKEGRGTMSSTFEGFGHAVCAAVPMASVTTFHIGGPARYFIEPRNLRELVRLFDRCANSGIPVRVLGGGSNILVSDRGVSGAVFRLSKMTGISRSGTRITCEAGVPLPRLVHAAEQWGLGGLEPLAGIPGTVGGAVAMNAGGRHGCVMSVLRSATTLDRYGLVRERSVRRLKPGYRHVHLHGEIVVGATFDLVEKDPASIAATRRSVLREKADTQPLAGCSAGCIFKNPAVRGAGNLIDLAGLKGMRVGGAVVSDKHANFIVNEGAATARDVRALISKVRRRVRKAFKIDLELEIEMWN